MKYTVKETKYIHNGTQEIYEFPNGYGASVVSHDGSYGGNSGLYEIAVLKDGNLCYDTPITSDVIGWLDSWQVESYLAQIESLPTDQEVSPTMSITDRHLDADGRVQERLNVAISDVWNVTDPRLSREHRKLAISALVNTVIKATEVLS